MKMKLSFSAEIEDEYNGVPETVRTNEEIKAGIEYALQEMCTTNVVVKVNGLRVEVDGKERV